MGNIPFVIGLHITLKPDGIHPASVLKQLSTGAGFSFLIFLWIVPLCFPDEPNFPKADPQKETSKRDSQSAQELGEAAVRSFSSGQLEEAIRLGEEALAKNPPKNLKADILFHLSSCYLKKGIIPYSVNKEDGFYQKSLKYAQQCVSLNPRYWQALENMATIHAHMKNLEQADFYYKKAERYVDPDAPDFQGLVVQHNVVREGLRTKRRQRE